MCLILQLDMTDTNYAQLFLQEMLKVSELSEKKREIDKEIKQVKAFARAAYNMLSNEDKQKFADKFEQLTTERLGFTEAVKRSLLNTDRPLAATEIKDIMEQEGFDFSSYKSNPLVSIHSVARRSKDIKQTEFIDGSVGYSLKPSKRTKKLGPLYGE